MIGDVQEFLSTLIMNGQSVPAGKAIPPAVQQFARPIVDQYVVLRFIRQQQDPPAPIHHQFMTILHRMPCIKHAPFGIHPISKIAMSDDRPLQHPPVDDAKGRKSSNTGDSGSTACNEIPAVHV